MNFRNKHRGPEEPEINFIPLIDVLLVILIFLMITTTYSKYAELQINLPTADAEKQLERPNEVNVGVTSNNKYSVNGQAIAFTTIDNLADAQGGEDYEIKEMYPPMLAEAEAEGDKKAARSMHFALEVEKVHYELYGMAIAAVTEGRDLTAVTAHVCPICGHTVIGDTPDSCPICGCPGERYTMID